MKILIVMECLGVGGTEQSLAYQLPEIARLGHQVEVAALYPPYTLVPQLRRLGIKVHQLNLRHRWSIPEAVLKLSRLGLRRYDIVHAKLFFAGIYVASSKLFGAKRIVSFHNLGYDSHPADTAFKRARKRLDSSLMRRRIDGYAALSRAVAEHYSRHLGVGPVEVVPNCVPPSVQPPENVDKAALRKELGIDERAKVVGMVARLVRVKGHRFMVQAADILRQRGEPIVFAVMGAGPEEAQIQAQVREHTLQEHVRLFGRVEHDEVLRFMPAFDAFCVPSTHEAFGLAPAEAMAMGVPVVASRIGGLMDLIEHDVSGWLIEPSSPEALANALSALLSDQAMQARLSEGAKLRIAQRFTPRSVAQKWIEVYERALAS